MSRYPEFDPGRLSPQSIAERPSKVQLSQLAVPPRAGASFGEFLGALPQVFAGTDFPRIVRKIVEARLSGRAVVVSCGGHVVKCGLAPVLIRLMESGLITAMAVNGALAIHDAELALFGRTSEDVVYGLQTGTFGMCGETAAFYNGALWTAMEEGLGAGEAIGRELVGRKAPFANASLLAEAYRLGIPLTVHIAVGTDIVHMHPNASGAAFGDASMRDFRILTAAMRDLQHGGVLMNLGSAVVLPEVLLKAISLLRNIEPDFTDFFGVNFDFIQQYRSNQQVVTRVRSIGGDGVALTGHHELMIPLLGFALMDAWNEAKKKGINS